MIYSYLKLNMNIISSSDLKKLKVLKSTPSTTHSREISGYLDQSNSKPYYFITDKDAVNPYSGQSDEEKIVALLGKLTGKVQAINSRWGSVKAVLRRERKVPVCGVLQRRRMLRELACLNARWVEQARALDLLRTEKQGLLQCFHALQKEAVKIANWKGKLQVNRELIQKSYLSL